MPSNHELFKLYTRDYPSPDSYVDASWLFIISSALQRRVWIDSGMRVYPNQYIFFVAPPGVGKSVTSVIQDMLSYWTADGRVFDKQTFASNPNDRPKMLYNLSATSTTFAKFVETMSMTRTLQYHKIGPAKTFCHSSVSFVLDELTSIFKRDATEMMTFLIEGYGCPDNPYSNETIGRGLNYIPNMCLNIIGGTQPDKFAGMRDLDLVSSGFTRRAIIIYENKSRHRQFLIPPLTDEQKAARVTLLNWIKGLHSLYGNVTIDPGALKWLIEWFADEKNVRINHSPYLEYYYASKQLHIHKLAMAMHFSESTAMTITLPTYQRAIKMLESFERNMHLAFSPKAANDVADVKEDVIKLLANLGTAATPGFLYTAFVNKVSFPDFSAALTDLHVSQRVSLEKDGRYKLNINGVTQNGQHEDRKR